MQGADNWGALEAISISCGTWQQLRCVTFTVPFNACLGMLQIMHAVSSELAVEEPGPVPEERTKMGAPVSTHHST